MRRHSQRQSILQEAEDPHEDNDGNGFGDDFDDFEEGGQTGADDDFGDFDEGFQEPEAETEPGATPPVSTSQTHSLPTEPFVSLRLPACQVKLVVLTFPVPASSLW